MKFYKKSRFCVALACFIWSWNSMLASATWWLLTVPAPEPTEQPRNTKGAKAYCNSLRYLSEKQKELCIRHPTIITKISEGVKVGIRECEFQFQNRRWNCTMYPGRPSDHAFEQVLRNKGAERAYIKAILSAAVSYTITRACSVGDLPDECTCAPIRRRSDHDSRKRAFEWGGCSDDVRIGDQYSRDFFDDKKRKLSQVELLDLHNNEAGRRAVRLNNKTTCRCHGLTGSCTQNICWRSLPPMRKVSRELSHRYNSAVRVRIRKSRVQAAKSKKTLTSNDLAFLKKSPTFCNENLSKGSYGTVGRWCNATSGATDGCDHMCCGRSHNTRQELKLTKCNCKFEWCCNLNCETCEELADESYCR